MAVSQFYETNYFDHEAGLTASVLSVSLGVLSGQVRADLEFLHQKAKFLVEPANLKNQDWTEISTLLKEGEYGRPLFFISATTDLTGILYSILNNRNDPASMALILRDTQLLGQVPLPPQSTLAEFARHISSSLTVPFEESPIHGGALTKKLEEHPETAWGAVAAVSIAAAVHPIVVLYFGAAVAIVYFADITSDWARKKLHLGRHHLTN